jgi:penicillin-binding protein 2
VQLFGDSLIGGAIAVDPNTGEVLALHSAPTYDPNRFIGGIPASYWDSLNTDPRRPLYNKVIQGRYPPASTWKLATAAIALQEKAIRPEERMPVPCSGGYQFGSRYFRCWDKRGHGNVNLTRAIEVSCDVYFYQLGLKLGLSRLVAGGVDLDFGKRSGIDLPEEARPRFPEKDYRTYYNKMYGARGWTNAVTLNLSIGQGENAQTVANMARFYTALATDGSAARPEIARREPERERLFKLSAADMDILRAAMAGVVSRGTARASEIQGVVLAGKTGTAQNSHGADHAWFVGFAPAANPKIVVSVLLEFGEHGSRAARIASAIISEYLKVVPTQTFQTEGE